MKKAVIWLFCTVLRFYQLTFSVLRMSLFPTMGCRYEPTCSRYMAEAVRVYGPLKGGWLGTKRLCRCHPWGQHGFDPVPKRKEGQVELAHKPYCE